MAVTRPTKRGINLEQAKAVIDRLQRVAVNDVIVVQTTADEDAFVTGRVEDVEMEDDGELEVTIEAEEDDESAYTVVATTNVQNLEAKRNPSPQLYAGVDTSGDSEDVASVSVLADDDTPWSSLPPAMVETVRGPEAGDRTFATSRAHHQANAF